jgi:prephenate dehydratase
MKAAFQGVRGAYSEIALKRHFGESCEAVGFAFSEQVFEAVETGAVDAGFLPVENSIAGPVAANADLFIARDVFVSAEAYLRIEHCLLGRKGASLSQVKTVYSHPVALAQCRTFLNGRGLKAIPEYDTAGAAQIVAKSGDPSQAAIASAQCADAYGLDVLERNIQSAQTNITRFFAFTMKPRAPKGVAMQKTSLVFATPHKPGALLACLKRFADHGVNLTRLESRPIPEDPFSYVFLVDLIGGLDDEPVKRALDGLAAEARFVKVLGSYPLGSPR